MVSVLRAVESDLNIRPGAVTLLLQLMGGNIVRAIILSIFPATKKHVSSPADKLTRSNLVTVLTRSNLVTLIIHTTTMNEKLGEMGKSEKILGYWSKLGKIGENQGEIGENGDKKKNGKSHLFFDAFGFFFNFREYPYKSIS